jgi:PHP family Zn ribbon phosphoesterase
LDEPFQVHQEELKNKVDPKIIEGIKRVRAGKVLLQPGFDGKYGEVRIFFKNKIKH